jgi:hypothetical protein
MEVLSRNVLVVRADLQWKIIGDHYLIGKFNLGKKGDRYQELLSIKNMLIGGGFTYAYKSLAGPIEITLMKGRDRRWQANLCLGFWF